MLKFKSAGIPVRPFKYFSMPILLRACGPCTCACNVPAHHDVTRFAYDVNHVTMTSPAFVFHSCHIGMMWHYVIGLHIIGTPCHYGSHPMGMTSLCSHHVHITLMMSSCSDHDVIATCMNHDFSHGT